MKLAILLPRWPDLGWIWRVKALVSALPAAAAQANESELEIAVGVHMGEQDEAVIEAMSLRGTPGVVVRKYRWEPVDCARASRMFAHVDFDYSGLEIVHVPRDWGWNFCDCDAWLLAPDLHLGAVMLLRPTVLFGRGIPERYDPTFAARHNFKSTQAEQVASLLSWRQVRCVFSSHERTLADFVSFAGLWRHRTLETHPLTMPAFDADLMSILGSSPRTNVLCLLDSPDIRGLDAFCRAARDALTNRLVAGIVFAVNGFPGGDGHQRRNMLTARLEAVSALDPARYRVESFSTVDDLARLLLTSSVVVSLDVTCGEPEALVWATEASCRFVGRRTPQAEAWARLRGLAPQFVDSFEVSALRRAIGQALDAGLEDGVRSNDAAKVEASLAALFERVREADLSV